MVRLLFIVLAGKSWRVEIMVWLCVGRSGEYNYRLIEPINRCRGVYHRLLELGVYGIYICVYGLITIGSFSRGSHEYRQGGNRL